MKSRIIRHGLLSFLLLTLVGSTHQVSADSAPATKPASPTTRAIAERFELGFDTPVDPVLQRQLEAIDTGIRKKFEMTEAHTAVGLLDLASNPPRLALLRPDREVYAASVPKIGILLAYFETHPEVAEHLDPEIRHALGLMVKASSNEMAARFSHELGLANIQKILTDKYHLYDAEHGGGIWVGKHYGKGPERILSPVGKSSHAATVRQVMRFWLMLEQGKLVSPAASKTMRDIFASPDIPHGDNKFFKGLTDRPEVSIIRKSGTWELSLHDSAVITGPGRHYILVGLTEHKDGDTYLEQLAGQVDEVMRPAGGKVSTDEHR